MAETAGEDGEKGRTGGEHGAAMLEYVLIGIVTALVAIVVMARFGGSLGGRYTDAEGRIEQAKAGGQSSAEAPGLEDRSSAATDGGSASASIPGESGSEEPRSIAAASNGTMRVGTLSFDLSTIIWLGALVLVAATLIGLRAFAANRQPKPKP